MSIGQGDVETTPLQMAVGYAAIANGGKILKPHFGEEIRSAKGATIKKFPAVVRSRVNAPAWVFRYVQRALGATSERGTATFPYRSWPLDRYPMASKTGSAESQSKKGARQPHSWFATFGPINDPRYVVVTVTEQAGHGSQVSGPISRRIMDELFGLHPLPIIYGGRSD
jgi:penicillin-binding protein 2